MQEEEKILETYDTFQTFFHYGNYGSAVVYLATIFYCFPNLNSKTRRRLEKQLEKVQISDDLIQAAKQELEKRIVRINDIISVGSRWNEDEILLLIQVRIEVDILLFFLDKIGEKSEMGLSEIDVWFDAIAISTEHKRDFEYAVKMIKRNWKIPITSKWLDASSYKKKGH